MTRMNCSKDQFESNGRCCDRCPAGKYLIAACDATKLSQCTECGPNSYTATENHVKSCQVCRKCSSDSNAVVAKNCTSTRNTECECRSGYYCSNKECDHCQQASICPQGSGVVFPASHTNDTICLPCKTGTFSNVSDYSSPCQPHTKCEKVEIAGTTKTDVICDTSPSTGCTWILPASLWSGLVLTAFIWFVVIVYRRSKHRSQRVSRMDQPSAPVTLVEMVPTTLPDLPLPSTKLNGHCQESCPIEDCKLPLFTTEDDQVVSCSMDSSQPITPLKVSVSFAESSHNNGNVGYHSSSFFRTYSEPQEDEWCGT